MRNRIASMTGIVLVAALSACGQHGNNGSTLNSDEDSSRNEDRMIEVSGEDAVKIYDAMKDWGVKDYEQRIGATNLKIENLRCTKYLFAGEKKADCNYKVISEQTVVVALAMQGVSSEIMFATLEKIGASVPGGINPGARAVAARSLTCSMPVIPNPTPHCVIEKL
jgi:hypothetical protein